MSRAESVSLLKKIGEINAKIDELKEERDELQKKIKNECKEKGHFFFCSSIVEEYDYDDNFIGTTYYSQCLICRKSTSDYYEGLYKEQINNGLYNCNYFHKIIRALINSNINEANEFLKEEFKYDDCIEKLQYMSKILNQIGYTINSDTKCIIPINEK